MFIPDIVEKIVALLLCPALGALRFGKTEKAIFKAFPERNVFRTDRSLQGSRNFRRHLRRVARLPEGRGDGNARGVEAARLARTTGECPFRRAGCAPTPAVDARASGSCVRNHIPQRALTAAPAFRMAKRHPTMAERARDETRS
ncbi:MAG: hypothetical protein N2038_15370 [Geminicoccaceae bacterium]|nr:hypothetical protein [Geminicoccaceae bacterium]